MFTRQVAASAVISILTSSFFGCATFRIDGTPQELSGSRAWTGTIGDSQLRKQVPKAGFISDSDAWCALWEAWRPDDELPPIDFKKELILVGTVDGPNQAGLTTKVDGQGGVTFTTLGTLIGGPGFGYQLLVIRRAGVNSVNGNLIPQVGAAADADVTLQVDGATRNGSHIEFASSRDTVIIDITSKTGIDRAGIVRVADQWPETVLVRLHLKGLEAFQVSLEEIAVEWSVASTKPFETRVALRAEGNEEPVDEENPYYSAVSMVSKNPAIPLTAGYFEIQLPAKLLEANPQRITLNWIDFYRN